MVDRFSVAGVHAACTICGQGLQPTERRCGSCGAVVNPCRSCGRELVAGDRFCPVCGLTVDPSSITARLAPGEVGRDTSVWAGIAEELRSATAGEFEIIRELGRGGMAAVYLGHDLQLDRKVAIKVMSPILASDERMVERFRREARTVAALKHPNIAAVHRVLDSEQLHFFVMDFVQGRSLEAIINLNGVLSIPIVRALMYQIGSGLAYAHRQKVYHRDVKPGNVLVSASDGNAVVTDFGIAKIAELPAHTQTGAVIGTPPYMAPEQIFGLPVTGAADQYALGIVAFVMLTGSPPFVGSSYEIWRGHTEVVPPRIHELRPDCPMDVSDTVARMLAKRPHDRFETLSQAVAAMGGRMLAEDDPIRLEIARLATPDDRDPNRLAPITPVSPIPATRGRGRAVTMIVISGLPETIEKGDTFRLTATPRDSSGELISGVTIDWSVADERVLTVDSTGLAHAVGPGVTEITATGGRARAVLAVSVDPARVSRVFVTPENPRVAVGDHLQMAARAVDNENETIVDAVRWSVTNRGLASITADGILEAVAPGSLEVAAEIRGVRGTMAVQITPASVALLEVSIEPPQPATGEQFCVFVTALDARRRPLANRRIDWTPSDPSVAAGLGDGVFEARKRGRARIKVECEGCTATADVTVAAPAVHALRVHSIPTKLEIGERVQLSCVALDIRGNEIDGAQIDWSSSNVRIIALERNGTIIGRAPGDAVISARCGNARWERSISVERAAAAMLEPAPDVAVRNAEPPRGRSSIARWAGIAAGIVLVATIGVWLTRRGHDESAPLITSPTPQGSPTAPTSQESPAAPKPTEPPATPVPVPTASSQPLPAPERKRDVPDKKAARVEAAAGEAAPVPRIVVSSPAQMRVGEGATALATVDGMRRGVQWSSSDPGVLSVNGTTGQISAVAEGSAQVIASVGKTRTSASVQVLPAAVAGVALPETRTMTVDEVAPLQATVTDAAKNILRGRTVIWTSERPDVASVDNDGTVRARAPGTAIITARVEGASARSTISVIAKPVVQREARGTPPNNNASDNERGAAVLRESVNEIVTALKNHDAGVLGRYFGASPGGNEKNLLEVVQARYSHVSATAPTAAAPQVADRRGAVRFRVHVEYTSVAGTNRARDVVFEVTTERDDTGWHAPRATIVDGWR